MDTAAPATPATPEAAPDIAALFHSAGNPPAGETAAPAPATPATPAATPAPAPTPAAPATPPAAPVATEPAAWLQELGGDYKSPDEVKQALAGLDTLRANQLTDDQRAVLTLAQDPEKWREFNQLTHAADYASMSDDEVLFEKFRQANPGETEDNLRYLFEEDRDKRFPGLAEEPDTQAHKAHASLQARQAKEAREALTKDRADRLELLKKGALPAAPAAEQAASQEQVRAKHLDLVKDTMGKLPAEGYKMTIDVAGTPFNLAVEASELPAIQAVMENPLAGLLNEAKDGLDPQKLLDFAVLQAHGRQLLAAAIQAGQKGAGVQVSLDELHNPDGTPAPAVAGTGNAVADQIAKAFGPTTRPKY